MIFWRRSIAIKHFSIVKIAKKCLWAFHFIVSLDGKMDTNLPFHALQTFLFPQNAFWFKEFAIQRKTKKISFPDEVEVATIAIDKATIVSLPF